ncbi:MAG: hypothetical protein ACKO9W_11055, partial [Bacteroidota bacterium]
IWLLGDFHPQSGNRLLGNTQRIPAFANPLAHIPGSEIPFASSRMSNGNQARGFSLQSAWGNHLIVMNSYALGILSSPLPNAALDDLALGINALPKTAVWMNSLAWEKERSWGILGIQFAMPSSLNLPASWNSSILTTQMIKANNTITPVDQIINHLKTLGFNYKIQRRNYFFQSNVAIRSSNPSLAWNKSQNPRHPVLDHILSWDYSQLHTLIMTPHPSWILGLRWSKLSQGTEASRIFSITLPTVG